MRKLTCLILLLLAACVPHPRRRPPPRPAGTTQTFNACQVQLRAAGIQFEVLPDRRYANGCSAISSVKLIAIGTPVTNLGAVRCPLALAFAQWVSQAVQPDATRILGTSVSKLESFGSFACRPVNNQAGNRLSEHAFANAIDIGGFQLADGRRITVKEGWSSPDDRVRRFLRAVHDDACRRFQIVLGPDANAFHRDHIHMDMGRGPYCR